VNAATPNRSEATLAEYITPSERELDILKVLWEIGSGSVREVHERLCPSGELAFNTVQTLLRIMEDKGLVAHRAEGRTFIYAPSHSREQVSSRFLDKVFDGALDQLVLSMLRTRDVSPRELRELEELIAQARRDRQRRDKEGN
jgi:predicted transcriptional regulator